MKKTLSLAVAVLGFVAYVACGAFVAPTADQIKQAAASPANITALLKDASVQQAADVIRDVIVQIVPLGLSTKDRNARIDALVTDAFKAMPGQADALALALGRAIAASPAASIDPGLVSAIQRAIIMTSGVQAGSGFGNSYNLAMQTIAGAPGGGKTVPPTPPPPPVALTYEGQ